MSEEILLGLGTGISVGGNIAAGLEGSRVARENALLATESAAAHRELIPGVKAASDIEVRRIREHGASIIGSQTAAAAASGVDVTKGSPLLVMLDTVRKSSEDAMLARYRGDVQAWQLLTQAGALDYQAQILKRRGRGTLIGQLLEAGEAGVGGGVKLWQRRKMKADVPGDISPYWSPFGGSEYT